MQPMATELSMSQQCTPPRTAQPDSLAGSALPSLAPHAFLASPPSAVREKDLQLGRKEREQEAELELHARARWELQVKTLQEEVRARRHTLENARSLMCDRKSRLDVDADASFRALRHECEHRSLLASVQQDAAQWQSERKKIQATVLQLESVVGKEAIRTERLRGCALTRRAKCQNLEKVVDQHSANVQKLTSHLGSVEQHMSAYRREGEQEQEILSLREQDFERSLESARQSAAESEAHCYNACLEATLRRDRETKQLKGQFQRRSTALNESIQAWKAECELTAASVVQSSSSSTLARRRSPHLDLGVRAASLRSAQHRQVEQGRKALLESEMELFKARQEVESEVSEINPSEECVLARLRQARVQLEVAEDTHARIRKRESEQNEQLASFECHLAQQPLEMARTLAALGAPCEALENLATGECKPKWPSPVEVARLREEATTIRVRSRKFQKELREEHEAATEEIETDAAQRLHADLNRMRSAHVQDIDTFEEKYETSMHLLQQELQQATASQAHLGIEKYEAKMRGELRAKLWRLDEEQRRHQATEAIAHENALRRVLANAEEVEQSYARLREALVHAHVEAERLHSDTLEEQATQEHKLRGLVARQASTPNKSSEACVITSWTMRDHVEEHKLRCL